MTKDQFLRRMQASPYPPLPLGEIPSDWWAAVWADQRVRDWYSNSMARTVSKEGSLSYAEDFLDLLSRSLTPGQLVELYVHIRDRSLRCESEWRGEFESAFPQCVSLLPAAAPEAPEAPEDGVVGDEPENPHRSADIPY